MLRTNNSRNPFSTANKNALSPGQEITDGDVIWRKLKDGTGVWRYDFRIHDQRFKGTIGKEREGVTLSQARATVQDIRAKERIEAQTRKETGQGYLAKQLFEEAAERFLKWSEAHHADFRHNKHRMDNHVLPYFSGKTLATISAGMVEDFRAYLLTEKELAKSTVKRIVVLLSNVFEYARQSDPNVVNPTRSLRLLRPTVKTIETFDEAQLTRLLNREKNPKVRDRAMVALGCRAGLRASEILGLTWENVDLANRQIYIRQTALEGEIRKTTKSGHARTVPISESLKPILEELKEAADPDSPWLFPGKDPGKPMYQVQAVFKRMKKAAGLGDAPSFHALRHTFATRALDNNVTAHALREYMGHSSLQMTEKYVHLTQSHSDQMAALLP